MHGDQGQTGNEKASYRGPKRDHSNQKGVGSVTRSIYRLRPSERPEKVDRFRRSKRNR